MILTFSFRLAAKIANIICLSHISGSVCSWITQKCKLIFTTLWILIFLGFPVLTFCNKTSNLKYLLIDDHDKITRNINCSWDALPWRKTILEQRLLKWQWVFFVLSSFTVLVETFMNVKSVKYPYLCATCQIVQVESVKKK